MEASLQNLQIGQVSFVGKVDPGNRGEVVAVKTNLNRVDLAPDVTFYKYVVRMMASFETKDGRIVERELTKQTRDDYTETERKTATVKVYKRLLVDQKDFFGNEHSVFYDRAAILYSIRKLESHKEFNLPGNYITGLDGCRGIRVTIKKVTDTFNASTNDVANCVNAIPSEEDRSLLEALNVVIAQPSLLDNSKFISYGNDVHYLYQPNSQVFREQDFPSLPDGKFLGVGAHKSIKILEGKGSPHAMVTTEIKKAAFHREQPLLEKIQSMSLFTDHRGKSTFSAAEAKRFSKQIKEQLRGLWVATNYTDKKFSFPILGVGEPARTKMVTIDGVSVTVEQYFINKYNRQLRFGDMFTIIGKFSGKKVELHFPVEVLTVCPGQRVTSSQQTPDQNSITIKACASLPADRSRQTEAMKKELGITTQNPYLDCAGIRVYPNPIKVKAREIPLPVLTYAMDRRAEITGRSKWTGSNFIAGASLQNWRVVGLFSIRDQSFRLSDFYMRLLQCMTTRGMRVSPPVECRTNSPDTDYIDKVFADAEANNVNLIFFVSSDQVKLHDYIKLMEAKYQILTQEVRTSRAMGVLEKGQRQTLDNIVLKTNEKLGGISKIVTIGTEPKTQAWIYDQYRMFIGFEFSHPDPMSKAELDHGGDYRMPSVIGWGANCGAELQSFVGDYRYIAPRQSQALSFALTVIYEQALRQFYKNRRHPPKHIFMYFNGISQGQWHLVAGEYLNVFDAVCKSINPTYSPKVSTVVVSKDHNERFYPQTIVGRRAPEQNIAPGTVIDSVIVSPVITEFFLNAHTALQGTTKTPKYSVLADTANMPSDVIQGITHGLTFCHGIVDSVISVPAPLMVADRCAKRGRSNFLASSGGNSASSVDLERANNDLTYRGKALCNQRYNA